MSCNDVLHAIQERYSVRAYQDRPVGTGQTSPLSGSGAVGTLGLQCATLDLRGRR